jgi:D-amino peptidase
VDFNATHPVAAVTAIPGVEAVGDRAVSFELPTMLRAIRCFKAVTVLASASVEETYG